MGRGRRRDIKCKTKIVQNNDEHLRLTDFANSPHQGAVTRLKKNFTSSRSLSDYANHSSADERCDLSWFERNLDEFSLDENESCDRAQVKAARTPSNRHRSSPCGNVYPLDMWFLISRFINPENVAIFARLCCATNFVVHTASFWYNLYVRFCHIDGVKLPADLRPTQLERLHGARTLVVRSLYHAYSPLIARVQQSRDPHNVVGRRCVAGSFTRTKNEWKYTLKFAGYQMRSRENSAFSPDEYNDVFHNSDEGCSILVVGCKSFHRVPPPIDLVVTRFNLSVSSQMCFSKLTLGFDTKLAYSEQNRQLVLDVVVVFDPVVGVSLYDWWHPLYKTICV